MYIKRVIEPEIIWYFSWRPLIFTTLLSSAVFVVYHLWGLTRMSLPFLPVATFGTAVAFYVGFKNNSSYDRLWESRKIWGELTNVSRALCAYLIAVMPQSRRTEVRDFVYRQIAYVNMLRLQLRRRNVWDDTNEYTRMSKECFNTAPYEVQAEEVMRSFCPDKDLLNKHNVKSEGWIDGFANSDMMRLCNELFNQQGKAERIKSFPFPRQYAYFSEVFVYIFVCLLPFGLIGEFDKMGATHDWLTIPFSILISWVFITMEKVGDTSENPFEGSLNDVPMTTICRNIEIDLKALLGEDALPAPMQAVDNILM
jgi:putative membrane protein